MDDDGPSIEDMIQSPSSLTVNLDDSSRDNIIPSPSSLEVNLDNVVENLQEQVDNIPRAKKYVHFSHLAIQEYNITIGDNPWCSDGTPITLDWDYNKLTSIDIDIYEATRPTRKNRKQMIMNRYQRRDKLWKFGYDLQDIEEASKRVDIDRRRKNMVIMCLPLLRVEEVMTLGSSRVREVLANGNCRSRKKQRQTIDDPKESSPTSPSKHDDDAKDSYVANDIETCATTNDDDTLSQRSSRNRQDSWSSLWQNIRQRQSSDLSTIIDTSSSTIPTTPHHSAPTHNPHDSLYPTYHVPIDPHQQDKSTEIILSQTSRPHMRAFHASWLSFFVAFFAWFSCTPLLSVMRRTLHLTKSDVWTSSLCSAAGTILARIVMGPACDKFGARLCTAAALLFVAGPVAATGAVRGGRDLCVVRALVGVAGSGFVACQCWTSRMFAREVAGTANALVAGWGNVGGGVAQLVMGSVLFPMGKVIYGGDEEGEEMAWRTLFVVPALLCLVMALFCVFCTDDCPKGDYRKRVKTNEIIIVDPCTSLCSAFTNWNVWILAIQYACCFGVEIAMTNAAPLYFEEQFDLSTEAAAAVASIFGFMNLFARGFGGFGSDSLNAKYGMTGRLTWQFVTLVAQAGGIVAFALARDLASAIVALVFCSMFVQSAEGSTFGIVPYVDRRYTGAVTGYVGAGGGVGGVLFAVFFREYSYEKAFISMAIAAGMSSFLCLVMNVKMLKRLAGETYELVSNKSH